MEDYVADIKNYTSDVNETAVKKIVNYCGIALRGKDSRYVSVSDPMEVKRVVDGFCKKKLGLEPDVATAAVMAYYFEQNSGLGIPSVVIAATPSLMLESVCSRRCLSSSISARVSASSRVRASTSASSRPA